jgi:hypothetical protein
VNYFDKSKRDKGIMKITYTLTQKDMEKIIADYMKEKYNFNKQPYVRIVKEKHDDYYDQDKKIEVIVGYVSEW